MTKIPLSQPSIAKLEAVAAAAGGRVSAPLDPTEAAKSGARIQRLDVWFGGLSAHEQELHLNDRILADVPDPIKAEIVMVALAHSFRRASVAIAPTQERSPFLAANIGEALSRFLTLEDKDVSSPWTKKPEELAQRAAASVQGVAEKLTVANFDRAGRKADVEPQTTVDVVTSYATRQTHDSSVHERAKINLDSNADQGAALEFKASTGWQLGNREEYGATWFPFPLAEFNSEVLGQLRAAIVAQIGEAKGKPTHPGLQHLGASLAGDAITLNSAAKAIDDGHRATRARAERARGSGDCSPERGDRRLGLLTRAHQRRRESRAHLAPAHDPGPDPDAAPREARWLLVSIVSFDIGRRG